MKKLAFKVLTMAALWAAYAYYARKPRPMPVDQPTRPTVETV